MSDNTEIILWDYKDVKFKAIAPYSIFNYHIGFSYESPLFKGYDNFALSHSMIKAVRKIYDDLNGSVRLDDVDCDTDGYIDITATDGTIILSGQLGSSFSHNSLKFEFKADQSLLAALLECFERS